jgi:hypothetical protein
VIYSRGCSARSPTAQGEERPVLNVGLFINTQFPGGFNLAGRVPDLVRSAWCRLFPRHRLTHPMQMLQITPVMGYVAAQVRSG